MKSGAAKWVWENSRAANGSLLVLLAIADECGKEEFAEMTVADLARKSRLSERGVQGAVRELAALGELSVTPGGGRGKRNRYSPCTGNPAESAPFDSSNPAESAPFTKTPQNLHPAESAPFSEHLPRSELYPAESAPFAIPDALKTGTGSPSVPVRETSGKRRDAPPSRPDVDRLCTHLADRIEAHGSRRPVITKRWRDAARLLIDNDGRTEEQVHACIDWCQQDNFWHRRIMSMEKLRDKYDQLRLDAKAEREKKTARGSRQQETDDLFARAMERARQADAMEAVHDPRGNGSAGALHQGDIPGAGN